MQIRNHVFREKSEKCQHKKALHGKQYAVKLYNTIGLLMAIQYIVPGQNYVILLVSYFMAVYLCPTREIRKTNSHTIYIQTFHTNIPKQRVYTQIKVFLQGQFDQ